MSREKPRNLSASVRQRLFNLAQERREDFGLVLTKYGLERFLYRLAQSRYQDQFILKGALLFELWTHRPYRPTRDLDLEGQGGNSIPRIKRLFAEIMSQAVEDDGLLFDPKSLRVARIKEDQEYQGLRVNFMARLERARIHMQVDVGFGDVIVPPPKEIQYPAMLNFPNPRLRAYPREAVVAEKLEALVKLGMANTRMKDFYDLWKLSHDFDFDGAILTDAIKAT
ncbi:MAG: nucleotidyl transferase AbiEii/AbiGii toxin family protein, partial [Candidatus Acidiferrales bacterium]